MKALLFALITVAFASALLASCSADEFKNPQRKDKPDCLKAGGTPIGEKFCVFGKKPDAGHADAGDAGSDSGTNVDAGADAAIDAGAPPMPCSPNDATESCYSGDDTTSLQLPCKPGMRTCRDGFWSECVGDVHPMVEECNGIDDDCDGKLDEDQKNDACIVENQQGACRDGRRLCNEGNVICAQITFPMTEICNGKDDDCNGMVDERTELSCYKPDDGGCTQRMGGGFDCVGACKAGVQNCVEGKYAECTGSTGKQPTELCTMAGDSEADENCNGMTDEGCTCNSGTSCYTGPQSTLGHAPCKAGTRMCSDATHGTCMNQVVPVIEDCSNEGKDDDCNGMVDDWAPRGTSCSDVSMAMGACQLGATWQCADGKATCAPGPEGNEICDGQGGDEDCDGKSDEDFHLDSDANNCGSCGHKCSAGQTCCDGSCVDTRFSNANCNGCGKACVTGQTCCSASCINPKADNKNCGSCGNACTGLTSCKGGSCALLGL